MKIAGILALLCALILAGIAISQQVDDANSSAQRTSDGFQELREHDYRSLNRDHDEYVEREAALNHEWIGAAVFAIAGVALIAAGRPRVSTVPSSTAS